ncbi:MAG: hypothetical protein AAGF81_18620 [Pseudomonadota bacterium]
MTDRIFYPVVALFSLVLFSAVYYDLVPVPVIRIVPVSLNSFEDPPALEAEMKTITLATHHVEVDLGAKLNRVRKRVLALGNLLKRDACDPDVFHAYVRALGAYGHHHRNAFEAHHNKWVTSDDRRIVSTVRRFISNGRIRPYDGHNISLHDDALKELRSNSPQTSPQMDYYYKCRKQRSADSGERANTLPTFEDNMQKMRSGTRKKKPQKDSADLKAARNAVYAAASRVRSRSCSKAVRAQFVKTFAAFTKAFHRSRASFDAQPRKLIELAGALKGEGRITTRDFRGNLKASALFGVMAQDAGVGFMHQNDNAQYAYYSKCAK